MAAGEDSGMTAVMSIDPSLTGLAIALHVPGAPLIEQCFSSEPAERVDARIERYAGLVALVLAVVKDSKPLCLVEGYSLGSKGRGQVDRAELGGILRYRLLPHVSRLVEVSPAALKKFATGRGNANKAAVVSALASRYRRTFSSDDQADAFALLQIGLCLNGECKPENVSQREVIAKLERV